MRSVFVLFLLVFYFSGFGQIINFSDPDFKDALVYTTCVDSDGDRLGDKDADLNNDRKIDVNEALNVIGLIISNNQISSLAGIEYFKNLRFLSCGSNQITSLNVDGLSNLTELWCSGNEIASLNLQGLSNLTKLRCCCNKMTSLNIQGLQNLELLDCSGNNLSNLNLHNVIKLTTLNCSDNSLTSLNVQGLINMVHLNCSKNKLTSLNATGLKKLNTLFCDNNELKSINVTDLNSLKDLICYENDLNSIDLKGLEELKQLSLDNNQFTSLDVSGLNKLTVFSCSKNLLTSLDVSGLKNLNNLSCQYTQLTSLDVSGLKNLNNFSCHDNLLTSLDVSGLKNLQFLNCQNNKLKSLFIKTGKRFGAFFNVNPDLIYICCDEENIEYVRSDAIFYGLTNCEINSYCSFTSGSKFYTIQGENSYDSNKNGCDDIDKKVPHIKYTITNGNVEGTILSNSTGNYSIPVQEGTHIITPVLENEEFFEISPPSLTVTFPGTSDTITQNFCITPKEPYRQVDITIIPLTPPARPGFDAQYKIIWENKGNLLETGTIHFTYDENIFDYVSANQTPDAINSGKLSWDYTDLLPFEKREVIVTLNLNSPMENPPVNAGDITYLYANILDNVFRLENVIVGSYDPNDKTCLQGQYFHPDSVGKYVDFLIRFENTGNFAAENVVIKDIIDDKTFDVSSLLITDASHEVYTRIAANKVEFIFENIQLPFEDETNDGYVAFKIKTKSTLKLGDEMKNLADIYFDYNFPIRTNETQTTIAIPSGTKDIQTEVTIHPNPVRDVLTLDSSNRWTKAEIFDISGRLIKVTGVDGYSVDVCGLDSGTYILHLSDKDKRARVKFVKM